MSLIPEQPCLPQDDTSPERRARALNEDRKTYRYSYTWPPGVATAAEVPSSDDYSAGYVAKLIPLTVELFANTVAQTGALLDEEHIKAFVEAQLASARTLSPRELGAWFFGIQSKLAEHLVQELPSSAAAYDDVYKVIHRPATAEKWASDEAFAWQRLAGVNPMSLTRITALPETIAITDAHVARALGEGASLAALAGEGRLYAVDYTLLDGAATGQTHGRQKFLPACYGLFGAVGGQLRPIAIQVGARPPAPVYGPQDGDGWRLARLAFQVAEASFHETVVHLGRTHMVMEAVTLATRRQLAPSHPLRILLLPHCEFTLPINHSAATNLIAPGGVIDLCFAGTIEASASFPRLGLDTHDLSKAAPPDDLAARGLDDRSVLPEHPYRDDGELVWAAIHRFVSAYVGRYYASDAAVVADAELAAWVAELESSDGGRLKGVGPIDSVETLARRVATFVWTATAQHSAVNFTQFPYMGVLPNMLGALWAEWPRADGRCDDEVYRSVLAPWSLAIPQFNTVYQLSSIRVNHLGRYGLTHFRDLGVHGLVRGFETELEAAEAVIAAREPGRYLPYPHLLPSTIPNSINI